MATQKKIIGIGNALMDIVVKLPSDEILRQNSLPKGSMTLVDASSSESINDQTEGLEKILAPGGSVANTIDGLARLGADAAFVGKVGKDAMGVLYGKRLEETGAKPLLFETNTPTGKAMALVTPDGERTFGTFLGAAIELSPDDLTIDLFRNYDIAYIEGYLVQNHDLVRKAVELAREAGLQIAIDLASYNVVEDNLSFLQEIVAEYVDIIFANEEESKAFTGLNPEDALDEFAKFCDIAIVKIGSKGSLIKKGDEVVKIGTLNTECIDSTGAGDLYAAGFLFGYSNNYSLEKCGKIAAITSGNVITIYGARMGNEMWEEIRNVVKKLD